MNKTAIASLIQIANNLDDLGLLKFSSEIDGILQKLAQTDQEDVVKQQIGDTERKLNDIPTQVENFEDQAKKNEQDANYMNTIAKEALTAKLEQLKEQLEKGEATPEEYQEAVTMLNNQTAPTGMTTPMIPSTIV